MLDDALEIHRPLNLCACFLPFAYRNYQSLDAPPPPKSPPPPLKLPPELLLELLLHRSLDRLLPDDETPLKAPLKSCMPRMKPTIAKKVPTVASPVSAQTPPPMAPASPAETPKRPSQARSTAEKAEPDAQKAARQDRHDRHDHDHADGDGIGVLPFASWGSGVACRLGQRLALHDLDQALDAGADAACEIALLEVGGDD
jgi:hypothetical protein